MKHYFTIALGSLALVVMGCGTARITDYQPASPPFSERTARESGVEVALDPFVERERTEKYFDIDAVGTGIAILHVRVANKTVDQTFLVKKEDFQLLVGGSGGDLTANGKKIERSEAVGIERSEAVGNAVGWVGVLTIPSVISPALTLTAFSMVSHSTEIQRNFTSKEMGDQTLSPGRSMEGFIYFTPVNRGEDWTRTAAVRIKLAGTATQHVVELNIPLSH